jgi:hypothetical protein
MNRDISAILESDVDVPPNVERLKIENTECWATKEDDAIHVFARDGTELYALSSKIIPYESKPLFLTIQIYMMGYNNGRANGQQEARQKLEKFAELLKACV